MTMFFDLRRLSTLILILTTVACGGGGGGSASADGTPNVPQPSVASTGVFLDSPVSGVTYTTSTQSGVTNQLGEFKFVPGEVVRFSVGNIQLPPVAASTRITPLELVGTQDIANSEVTNILIFLQSLDADNDPSNGIEIANDVSSAANVALDFKASVSTFTQNQALLNLVALVPGGTVKTANQAVAHFSQTARENDLEIAPVANASVDQNVSVGSTVTLDGTSSYDPNGDQISYTWSTLNQPQGSSATLSDSKSARPTFTADVAGTYSFGLTVNDGKLNSASDQITVVASVGNSLPVANAGADQTGFKFFNSDIKMTLDGSSSYDPDGDSFNFFWSLVSKPVGSKASISSDNPMRPTLLADLPGMYVVSLVTRDAYGTSLADNVTLTITEVNMAPVANAGDDFSTLLNTPQTLDGTGSSDFEGLTLNYSWTLISKPTDSQAVLSDSTSAKPTFTADIPGHYVFGLIVSDWEKDSALDTVTATASELATPSGLRAFSQDSAIQVRWNPDESYSSYRIYYSSSPDVSELSQSVDVDGTNSHLFEGLSAGSTYHFRVATKSGNSLSGLSVAAWSHVYPNGEFLGNLTPTASSLVSQLTYLPPFAVQLNDSRVLFDGTDVQLLNTVNDTSETTDLLSDRDLNTSSALVTDNGLVVVAGGLSAGTAQVIDPAKSLGIYDFSTNTRETKINLLTLARRCPSMTLLDSRQLLIAGGIRADYLAASTSLVYDLSTKTSTEQNIGISYFGPSCPKAVKLFNGDVLFTNKRFDAKSLRYVTISQGSGISISDEASQKAILSDGRVVEIANSGEARIYDPSSGEYTDTSALPETVDTTTCTGCALTLPNGRVLVIAKSGTIYTFNEATLGFDLIQSNVTPNPTQALVLHDGRVFVRDFGYLY